MGNTMSDDAHERTAEFDGGFIESKRRSLWWTSLMVWMREPMRPISAPEWIRAMRKSARLMSMGPTMVRMRNPLLRTAEVMEPARKSLEVKDPKAMMARTAAQPTVEEMRQPLLPMSLAELVDLTRRHECPHCHGRGFRRSRPRSVEWLLSLVRVIPYRCYSCNHRFFGLSIERDPAGRVREFGTSLWYTHRNDPD